MFRVMVVDDDPVFHKLAKALLRVASLGAEVVAQATSGDKAVELIRRVRPDLVLMDVNMPGMDGFEVAEQITSLYPRVRIILVSACEEEQYSQRAAEVGAEAFLCKRDMTAGMLRCLLKVSK